MGSLSLSEILTILVVVLIVFGPKRLPELARTVGRLMAKARDATSSFTRQLESEYGDAIEPITGLKDQYDGIKQDLTDAVTTIGNAASVEPAVPPNEVQEKGPTDVREDDAEDDNDQDANAGDVDDRDEAAPNADEDPGEVA